MRKTKIICTIGPSSCDEKTITEMIKAGMNVARLNFSHGTHEYHKEIIERIKRIRNEMKVPVAIMLDTKGPEIRVRSFKNGSEMIETGAKFVLTTKDVEGTKDIVSITYHDLPSQLKPGQKILIDDGNITLSVDSCTDTDVNCTVLFGGVIKNNKGINVPNVRMDMKYLSEKDEADLIFGVENDVDFVAASFVRRKEDVVSLRRFIDYNGGHDIKIISKIENIEGVENFDEILEQSDGIMIARGDMGVEIEYERLPGIQKKAIRKVYRAGKMAITATQMMESMIHNNNPTRAEISDVANAVFDGTSAIMLSGETAAGDHPVTVVKAMAKIARQAEKDAFEMDVYNGLKYDNDFSDITNAICDAACTTARDVDARAIIAVTKSGYTARRVSKFRPIENIIASTPSDKTFNQLALSWGVYPVLAKNQTDEEKLFRHAVDCAMCTGLLKEGDRVVITAGMPLNIEGNTNLLKVETIGKAVK